MNNAAREYYAATAAAFRQAQAHPEHAEAAECTAARPPPVLRKASGFDGGVTWYRGFSAVDDGAGTNRNCVDAAHVAAALHADTIVLGHSAHDFIQHYCGQHGENGATPDVYAVDTHEAFSCYDGECD